MTNKQTVTVGIARNDAQLTTLEEKYSLYDRDEFIIYSKGESFSKIVNSIFPDKMGVWANDVYLFITKHNLTIGISELQKKINDFLNLKKKTHQFDSLSISVKIENEHLEAYVLVRFYGEKIRFKELYDFIGAKDEVEKRKKQTDYSRKFKKILFRRRKRIARKYSCYARRKTKTFIKAKTIFKPIRSLCAKRIGRD